MSSRRTCGELLCNASVRFPICCQVFSVSISAWGGRAPNIQAQLNVFAPHLRRIPLQSLLGSAQALCGPCFKLVTISMNVYAAGARFKHIVCAALGRYDSLLRQHCSQMEVAMQPLVRRVWRDVPERKVPPTCVSVSRLMLPLAASVCFDDVENRVPQNRNRGPKLNLIFGVNFQRGGVTDSCAHHQVHNYNQFVAT